MAVLKESTLPKTFAEYKPWLRDNKKFDSAYSIREYEFIQAAFEKALSSSDVWNMVRSNLKDYAQEYYIKTGLDLLHMPADVGPKVLRKDYESFLEKTYRYSFLKEGGGPVSEEDVRHPSEYYGVIDDILRTLIIVKFLDGVEFVARKLDALCNACQIGKKVQYKCNDQGYFAAHYYLEIPVSTQTPDGKPFVRTMPFEVQITTQLQEVLRRFLHFEYERSRLATQESSPMPWQWRYREQEFFSNYLGHMIRNVEGQIMEARRRRNIADACAE